MKVDLFRPRPKILKTLENSHYFLLQCEAQRNSTVAQSPQDSDFLCTFKLKTEYSSIAQSVERRTVNP